MADYTDVPQINMLYQECEKVDAAIKMIDDGTGTLGAFTIVPKPLPPGTMPTTMMMAQTITLPGEAQQSTVAEIRLQLVTYQAALLDQLAALGVTETPARAA